MRVDIERIYQLLDELKDINTKDLSDLTFYQNGQKINIDPRVIDDFAFIGLNNVDFITSHYYEDHVPFEQQSDNI